MPCRSSELEESQLKQKNDKKKMKRNMHLGIVTKKFYQKQWQFKGDLGKE